MAAARGRLAAPYFSGLLVVVLLRAGVPPPVHAEEIPSMHYYNEVETYPARTGGVSLNG